MDPTCIAGYIEDFWADSESVTAAFDSLWLAYEEKQRQQQLRIDAEVEDDCSSWQSEGAVLNAVAEGRLIRGVMRVDRHHFNEALVLNSGSANPAKHVLLPNREKRSNAVHGDVVAVELLPMSEWERRVVSVRGDIMSSSLQVRSYIASIANGRILTASS